MASELEVGKLGAGVAPAAPLHAKVAATTASSPLEVARLEVEDNLSGVNMNAGMGPKLSFYTPRNSESIEGASIAAKKESGTDETESTTLAFSTTTNGDTSPTERLTIDSTGKTTIGDVEINGTYNLQLTDVANGGVSQAVMRQSRGTTASPTNSSSNGDGNYISSQIYNNAYTTISQIGMVTGSAVNTGRLLFRTSQAGGALTTRVEIGSTGLATFSNGITVSGANNWSHITSSNDQSLSIADDAQVQLADVEAGAMMIHIYDRGAGHGAVIFATYFGQPELVAGSSTYFDVADTDGKICVIKSSSSHDVYLKNRRGSTKQFSVLVTAGVLDDF